MNQSTLVLIKPDAVKDRHIGDIIAFIEKETPLVIVSMWIGHIEVKAFWEALYQEHKAQIFYPALVGCMQEGPVVALWLRGPNAVEGVRNLVGFHEPSKARSGTLRARFGTRSPYNAVHASATEEDARRELKMFFSNVAGFLPIRFPGKEEL